MGIKLNKLVVADRITEAAARFGKRGARPGTYGPPAIMKQRAVAKHLEVLGEMQAGCGRIGEAGVQGEALDRALADTADGAGGLDAEGRQYRGHHVNRMAVLGAHLTAGGDALGPAQNEGIAGATPIGLALPAAERGVAGVGPAPGVVVEVFRSADVIDGGQVLLQIFGHVVEELALIHRTSRPPLGTGTVIGNHHD